jgi:H/ACA ribonucleoprotein complex subunit 4
MVDPQAILTKDEEPTEPSYGFEPTRRPLNELLQYGLIKLDKPRGPTRHEVVAWVRKLLKLNKAGHSGTLDPYVSGLLPIGLGEATKALSLLLLFPKEYWAVMRIHSSVPRRLVNEVIREFTGEIYQRPPQRSSVRRDVRTRTIYELDIAEQDGNLFLLRCSCQAGTYVRKLVYDVGEILGVGATMVELRRTRVGPLTEEQGLVTLHKLNQAVYELAGGDEQEIRQVVRPIEEALGSLRRVSVRDSTVDALCHGAKLAVPGILTLSQDVSKGEIVVILTAKGELIAIGEALMPTEDIMKAEKGLAFSIKRVIMKQGTYPRLWKKAGTTAIETKNPV